MRACVCVATPLAKAVTERRQQVLAVERVDRLDVVEHLLRHVGAQQLRRARLHLRRDACVCVCVCVCVCCVCAVCALCRR